MIAVEKEAQTKTVSLANVAGTKQLEQDFGRVNLELRQPFHQLKHVVFDMSVVDPLKTNAPRVFEMVKRWHHRFHKRRISVRMKMPRLIYDDLQRTERRLPPLVKGSTKYAGIGIEVIDPGRHLAREIDVALEGLAETRDAIRKQQTIILSCTGKVRKVAGNRVTVSLFTPEGEIIGDFVRSQFPEGSPRAGKIFQYDAGTKGGGRTETNVQWIPERALSDDELAAIDQFVDASLPPEPHSKSSSESNA